MRILFFTLFFSIQLTFAQGTWNDIHSLFQSTCAVACHNNSSPSGNLLLNGTSSQVYNQLVGVNPVNPVALQKGNKRIFPGYPERSFLLRKCNNGWDPFYQPLQSGEGDDMPQNLASLSPINLEKIRQWILFGAPATGVVVADSTLQDYYGGLALPRLAAPPAPPQGQGIQVRLGPFLMEPGTETEFYKKHQLIFPDSTEVNRVDVEMNWQSHHFLIYKFYETASPFFPDGLRGVNNSPSGNSATLVSGSQYSTSLVLPYGAAYRWEKEPTLDLNYHLVNYNSDSILAAETYFNLYTQPNGTAQAEMYSALINYGQVNNNNVFFIPPDGQEKVFADSIFTPGSTDEANIWLLSTHTHQWGVDYDIYKRNADGTRGAQLYEGFYDRQYNFNQGYYDWAHPAIREFEPLETIKLSEGLIHEARFRNFGNDTVYFGLTTQDEMMLIVVQYTVNWKQSLPGTSEYKKEEGVKIYPNPMNSSSVLAFELQEPTTCSGEVYDMSGRKIAEIPVRTLSEGSHQVSLDRTIVQEAGIYIIKFRMGDHTQALRLLVEN